MEKTISKEEVEKLHTVKGDLKGIGLKNYASFVLKEEGKKGLEKLERIIKSIGYDIKYQELKPMSFYPLWLSASTFLILYRVFGYSYEKFQEMGSFSFKISGLMRFWARFFVSAEEAIKYTARMHKMYFTVGDFELSEYNEEQRYIVVRLKNFPAYPIENPRIYCYFLAGYYSSILQTITGKKVSVKERKCFYNGDDYHEFFLQW